MSKFRAVWNDQAETLSLKGEAESFMKRWLGNEISLPVTASQNQQTFSFISRYCSVPGADT